MRPTHLDGLVFSQAEMLALMHAVRPVDLVGIDASALIPADPETHRDLIRGGIQQLAERDLLSVEGEIHVLNADLLVIARVVAFPSIVTVLIKDVPAVGQQRFTYYQANQFVVEHTMPEAQQYRFAALPDVKVQMERMTFILPVRQELTQPSYDIDLPQDAFFRVRELVLAGELQAAAQQLQAQGLAPKTVHALLQAMTTTSFSGTVAYLKVDPPRVVVAHNLAFLQGQRSAWAILPGSDGRLRLRTIVADETTEVLFAGWQELAS